jgi:hypothetical protein
MAIDDSNKPIDSPEGRPPDKNRDQQPSENPAETLQDGETQLERTNNLEDYYAERNQPYDGTGFRPTDSKNESNPDSLTPPESDGSRDRQGGDAQEGPKDSRPPPGSVQAGIAARERDLPARDPSDTGCGRGNGLAETRPNQEIERDENEQGDAEHRAARAAQKSQPYITSIQRATGVESAPSSARIDVPVNGPLETPTADAGSLTPAMVFGTTLAAMAIRRAFGKGDKTE